MRLLTCSTVLVLLSSLTSDGYAEGKPVKLRRELAGSVLIADKEEVDYQLKTAPEYITNAQSLKKVWTRWKIRGQLPKVDFTKEIVVVAAGKGVKIKLDARLDDGGNLEVRGLESLDTKSGFRYVLATVSREGIKTVNKHELPKE
jgi:hypothetical protein